MKQPSSVKEVKLIVISVALTLLLIFSFFGNTYPITRQQLVDNTKMMTSNEKNVDGLLDTVNNKNSIKRNIQLFEISSEPSMNSWNLEGTVYFKGKPCAANTNLKVPPCTGPYPNYEIIVYADGSEKDVVSTTKTDLNGNYKMLLNPGNYVIYTQAGIFPSNMKANNFTIEEEKITNLDLFIDTGIK